MWHLVGERVWRGPLKFELFDVANFIRASCIKVCSSGTFDRNLVFPWRGLQLSHASLSMFVQRYQRTVRWRHYSRNLTCMLTHWLVCFYVLKHLLYLYIFYCYKVQINNHLRYWVKIGYTENTNQICFQSLTKQKDNLCWRKKKETTKIVMCWMFTKSRLT